MLYTVFFRRINDKHFVIIGILNEYIIQCKELYKFADIVMEIKINKILFTKNKYTEKEEEECIKTYNTFITKGEIIRPASRSQ